MVSKVKVDAIESTTGSGTIALNNQFSGMSVASLPTLTTTEIPTLTSSHMPTGSVLQVVNNNHSSEVTNANASWIATGLTASITPSSTSSKILILMHQNSIRAAGGSNTVAKFKLQRGSTDLVGFENEFGLITPNEIRSTGCNYLDAPSTTSQVTYSTVFYDVSGSGYTVVQSGGTSSTMVLMEIKG
jgi:hypothetical protein